MGAYAATPFRALNICRVGLLKFKEHPGLTRCRRPNELSAAPCWFERSRLALPGTVPFATGERHIGQKVA